MSYAEGIILNDALALVKYISEKEREEKLLASIVRNGKEATVGYAPELKCEFLTHYMQKKEARDYSFDNIRAVLIICVVFAHLLEIGSLFLFSREMYTIIYSFHMPLFLFVCGWFAKYKVF